MTDDQIENAWLEAMGASQWERERVIAFARAILATKPTSAEERAAFESWAPTAHMRIERWTVNPELYDDEDAISAWNGWEARAAWALGTPPPAARIPVEGPVNPGHPHPRYRLRHPGESAAEYRIAMGWDKQP